MLIGAEEAIPEGFFEKLLGDRRVLVILDGISEMPGLADISKAARPQNPDFSVNALLVTSRGDEKLNPEATIEPQPIDTNHLLPFINAYLSMAGHQELSDSELFDASRRLADLVTMETGITPLLARLFAEQLVDLQDRGEGTDKLPRDVPALMLDYLNSINRQRGDEHPDYPEVHQAAKITAWACLRKTFRPGRPGPRKSIRNSLSETGLSEALLDDLEIRLRIVKTVGADKLHVQFELDPLAEYLAALAVVDENGGDEGHWRSFLSQADGKTGAPESIRGFLVAVRDCLLAQPASAGLGWVVNELANRISLDLEPTNAATRQSKQLSS